MKKTLHYFCNFSSKFKIISNFKKKFKRFVKKSFFYPNQKSNCLLNINWKASKLEERK